MHSASHLLHASLQAKKIQTMFSLLLVMNASDNSTIFGSGVLKVNGLDISDFILHKGGRMIENFSVIFLSLYMGVTDLPAAAFSPLKAFI